MTGRLRGAARMRAAVLLLAIAGLAQSAPLAAHRLDEYLQAARIAVDVDRVAVELDLTPGVAIAPSVLAGIDQDGDGEITASEGEAYARQVIDGLAINVDGRPIRPALEAQTMPARREIVEGTGVIRLLAAAPIRRLASGRHALHFRNVHRSEIGVYLVNALAPEDDRVEITAQRRDFLQHELTIDFRVRPERRFSPIWSALAGFIVATTFGVLSVRRRFK